jgi:hypothetical protein
MEKMQIPLGSVLGNTRQAMKKFCSDDRFRRSPGNADGLAFRLQNTGTSIAPT